MPSRDSTATPSFRLSRKVWLEVNGCEDSSSLTVMAGALVTMALSGGGLRLTVETPQLVQGAQVDMLGQIVDDLGQGLVFG